MMENMLEMQRFPRGTRGRSESYLFILVPAHLQHQSMSRS